MPQAIAQRTPAMGGMNQDDSLITPAFNNAGRNMFEIGDYRYANNARIGSSRDDSMGDLENLRGTEVVADYFSNISVIENGNFANGLDDWNQTSDPSYIDWIASSSGARLTIIPDSGGDAGPAPTFVSKGLVSATVSSSVTPTYPAGIQQGDIIFLMALSKQPVTPDVIQAPAGWTILKGAFYANSSPTSVGYGILLYKIATGSEVGSVTVTRNGPTGGLNSFIGQIYVWRGTAPVIEASAMNQFGQGNATVTWNAVTVGGNHRNVLAFVAQQSNNTPDTPAGYTSVASDSVNSGPVSLSLEMNAKQDTSTDGSVTASGGHVDGWISFSVSIYDPITVPVPTPFISEVLYQTIVTPIAGQTLPFSFALGASNAVSSGVVKVVFMNGSSIVEEQTVFTGSIFNFTYGENLSIPLGVDGIGVRVEGTVSLPTTIDMPYVNLIARTSGGRPTGNERVIGRIQDDEFLKVWYCVWNSEGTHTIRYYDKLTNAVYEVLRWSGLNWQETDYIKMAKLDNWIAFTGDGRNRPRLIDVDNITNLSLTLGSEFREFHISLHKWAPTVPPIPRIYYDGETNNYERLKNKVFQFSYRYIYKGNLKSRWSPISKGATTCFLTSNSQGSNNITAIELDIPGSILNNPSDTATEYNFFDHNDTKFTNAVASIEIAYKDGEFQLWKLWKRISVNSLFNRFHYFDGTGNSTPLDDDFFIPFDTVPFIAGTTEAIDNRFVLGNCLDEHSPAQGVSATDRDIYNNGQFDDDYWGDARTAGFSGITNTVARDRLQRLNATARQTFKDRATYKFGIQFFDRNGWRSGVYTDDSWTYQADDITGFANGQSALSFGFKLPASFVPPDWAVGYQIMRTNALNMDYYMFGLANNFSPIIDDLANLLDQMNLPEDVKKRIQERFNSTFNVSGDEVTQEVSKELDNFKARIAKEERRDKRKRFWNTALDINEKIGIGSVSPDLIFFNRNFKKWFTRNPIGPQLQQQLRMTKVIDPLIDASRIRIDINNWLFAAQDTATKEFPLNNLIYNYRPGDRIRFTGAEVTNPTPEQLREYDVPIIEFTGQSIIIEKPEGMQWISRYNVASPQDFTIEVYSPMTAINIDHIFYEMGEYYPILFPGQSNRDFAKRDFTWSGQNAVTLAQYGPFDVYSKMPVFFGDSYLVAKTLYRSRVFMINEVLQTGNTPLGGVIFTSMVPDKDRTYDVWDRCNGRPAPAYTDLPVEKFKATQVRYGGRIIEESFVNSLNQFEDGQQFIYPSEYGRIRDLVNTANAQVESVGSILLAIGERETWSIYVNRRTLEDLSGDTQVSISDAVLGSYNALLGSHGTLNPESVSKYRGRVYFWNALDGSWLRYGRDGLTEISENKMRNWFKDLGDLMLDKYLTSEKPTAVSEFDPFNNEFVTFQNHSALPSTFRGYEHYKGAIFSEDDTRWKSIHDYTPELMSKIGNLVIAFRGGDVYLLERSETYSTFFGEKKDVLYEPVFNDNPHDKKVWKALSVLSTEKWSAERILSEYRGLKAKQQSRIPIESFENREDLLVADVKRDLNTPNTVNPIVEGWEMRSKAIQVLMKLDPTVTHRMLLHYVDAQMTDSPMNT